MSPKRIALIAAGLLVAAGALFWVVRGVRAAGGTLPSDPAQPAAGAPGGGKARKAPPPRWQSFLRPDERQAPPRPVVRLAQSVPNPFDRLAVSGAKRPGNPGLRLEGISAGAQAVALISGRALRQGDVIAGFRVVRIGRSAVTLAGAQGARLALALEGGR